MPYKDKIKKVTGKPSGEIFIFALSTCVWCKKTKALIKNLGLAYEYVDVDLLDEKEQDEVQKEFDKLGIDMSFPTILMDKKIISGFKEEEIMGLLK